MAVETSDLVRMRGVFEVLDDACDLYRDRFLLCVCLVGLVGVPAYLIYLPAISYGNAQLQQRLDDAAIPYGALAQYLAIAALVGGPILDVARVLQTSALAEAVRQLSAGGNPSVRSVLSGLRSHTGALVAATALLAILSIVGGCTLYLLNLVLYVTASFVGAVIVFEGLGAVSALRRSLHLARANLWLCIGVSTCVVVLDWFLAVGVEAVIQTGFVVIGTDDEQAKFISGQVANAFASFLIAPIRSLAAILLYLSLRTRVDAWDLVREAHRRGVTLAPEPPS